MILGNKSDINECLNLQIIRRLDDLLSAGSTCMLGMRSLVRGIGYRPPALWLY